MYFVCFGLYINWGSLENIIHWRLGLFSSKCGTVVMGALLALVSPCSFPLSQKGTFVKLKENMEHSLEVSCNDRSSISMRFVVLCSCAFRCLSCVLPKGNYDSILLSWI